MKKTWYLVPGVEGDVVEAWREEWEEGQDTIIFLTSKF